MGRRTGLLYALSDFDGESSCSSEDSLSGSEHESDASSHAGVDGDDAESAGVDGNDAEPAGVAGPPGDGKTEEDEG